MHKLQMAMSLKGFFLKKCRSQKSIVEASLFGFARNVKPINNAPSEQKEEQTKREKVMEQPEK